MNNIRTYLPYVLAITAAFAFLLWFIPTYQVWAAEQHGKAQYRKASYNRRVKVLEATAEYDAAKWLQGRDTVRAMGINRTNRIIGDGLKNNEPYLAFYWMETLKEIKGQGQVIYLPGLSPNFQLPITEAGRLRTRDTVTVSKPD